MSHRQSKWYVQIADETEHYAMRENRGGLQQCDMQWTDISVRALVRIYWQAGSNAADVLLGKYGKVKQTHWQIKAGEYSTINADTQRRRTNMTKTGRKTRLHTFLDLLRWLFLLDELGHLLRQSQLFPISSHLCNGLNTSWVTARENRSGIVLAAHI